MATYYFAAAGVTGNSGTSAASPWPLSKVNTVGVGGDTLFFNGGDIFGSFSYTRSGTAGNPIKFDKYGTGHNPRFDAGAANTPTFTLNANYIQLNNLYLKNSQSPNGLLYIMTGNHDITLNNVAFGAGMRGINAYHLGSGGVVNLVVSGCWFFDIFDTLQASGDTAHGAGSHIQLNNCNGSGMEIVNSKFYTKDPSAANNNNYGVGDIISQYQSNGTAASRIWVHGNQIRGGGNNQVTGYIGITCGDVGGSYQLVENNILVDSGQGGIGIMPSGAIFCTIQNNRLYSKYTGNTSNYVGLTYNSVPGVANCVVQNNNVTWYATGKTGPYNKFAFQGPPAGWNTNTADTAVDPLATETMLPNPLFNEFDWDTGSTSLTFPSLTAKTYGNADFAPGATSSNSITYTSSNPAVATIVSGNIHIVGAGSANITANDGTSSLTQPLTVNKAPLTVTAGNASKTYGAANPTLSATITGYVLGESSSALTTQPTVTSPATAASVPGSYATIPAGGVAANYSFTYVNGTLTINKASLTITANNLSRNYGAANPALTASYTGFVNGDTSAGLTTQPTLSTSATPAFAAGSYTINISGAASSKYNISYVTGTLTINKITLTITANNQSKVFNAGNPILTASYSGFVNGDNNTKLTAQPVLSTTAVQSSPVGTYPITVSGAASPNYNFAYVPGTLTISANAIAFGPITPRNYGDPDFDPGASSTSGITYTSDNPAVATIVANEVHIIGAGSANITASNGSAAATQPLTVNKAALTITANSHAISQGDSIPLLDVTYSGFQYSDTSSVLTAVPSVSTTGTSSSPIGNYPITPAGAAANNYTISYVNGVLSIIPTGTIIHLRGPVIVLT